MPYTTREAVIVALHKAGIEESYDVGEQVIENLKKMGFAVIDVHHRSDLEVAQAAYDAGHPTVMPPRLSHVPHLTAVDAQT